ncbi:hypothetical protein CFD26_103716 [Aspergillus turcosus]|uniref:AMP-dependent synthetase/ligase domain-containing protein n=1 Tax=Aspergillus turcosus TaxID=1245748 RepID=A0A3R7G8C9_9EURO|nr:hypothetical protein CFD26_103716 [Aspergillus turcosus]
MLNPNSKRRLLPDDTIFSQLVQCAIEFDGPAFCDPDYEVTADHRQLIHDVFQMRERIYETIPSLSFDDSGLLREENMFILLLAPNGYEFVVGCLAILSVGGAVVPLASSILPEEALYFFGQCQSELLVTGSKALDVASSCQEYAQGHGFPTVKILPIEKTRKQLCRMPMKDIVDRSLTIPPSRPGLVIFTSGSTGPPKGVVLPRACFYPGPLRKEEGWICPAHRHVHWAGGATQLIHMVLEGVRLDFIPHGSSPAVFWEHIRQRRVTLLAVIPMLLVQLKTYFETQLMKLPPQQLREYVEGARHIRVFRVGSAMPAPETMQFWERILGRPVHTGYGSTEGGGIITIACGSRHASSIGKPLPDTCLKLSEGDHGEILLKSPRMLLRYLNNEEATRAVLDEDGFYHTGDLAHLEGDEYIFDGRASSDFIRFNGYKVSILELEHALMSLECVTEAYVVPVADAEYGEQAAAIIRPCSGFKQQTISLQSVREDLSKMLPIYMLPTMLLVLSADEVLPQSSSGKISRATLQKKYFNHAGLDAHKTEVCKVDSKLKSAGYRPWDWAGLQRTAAGSSISQK